jgi:hypothetical protein
VTGQQAAGHTGDKDTTMKTGRTLQEIAVELERQLTSRKDYLAPQGQLNAKVIDLVPDAGGVHTTAPPAQQVVLDGFNGTHVALRNLAHQQLADHLGIPRKYYDRMATEQPHLLAENLNTWLHDEPNAQRMVRTLDGQARAFLSPKFRPLDNFDLANAVLPTLLDRKVQIMSCELTETRFYIKGILPDLSEELPTGMTWGQGHQSVGRTGRLVAAIVISNSEVGAGTLRIEPSVFTTWCTNLAIMAQAAMKKYHVGRAWEADTSWEVMKDDTRAADDAAFWLKVRDVTHAAFDGTTFAAAIAQIRDAAAEPITSLNLPKVVEIATKRLALPERAQTSILGHLARGGDLTKWGLSSAVTATANDWDDYEGATDLERAGGLVLALDGQAWQQIAQAAA